jgi:hypothetical protein
MVGSSVGCARGRAEGEGEGEQGIQQLEGDCIYNYVMFPQSLQALGPGVNLKYEYDCQAMFKLALNVPDK